MQVPPLYYSVPDPGFVGRMREPGSGIVPSRGAWNKAPVVGNPLAGRKKVVLYHGLSMPKLI